VDSGSLVHRTATLVFVGGRNDNGVCVAVVTGAAHAAIRNVRKIAIEDKRVFTGIPHIMPLTAYPAIAGGAAKTNSEGGESFHKVGGFVSPTMFTKDGNSDLYRTRRTRAC